MCHKLTSRPGDEPNGGRSDGPDSDSGIRIRATSFDTLQRGVLGDHYGVKSSFRGELHVVRQSCTRLVVVSLFSMVASAQTTSCTASSDVACTEQGAVRGAVQGATMAFKGIPYAAPPVGSLRWRPPTPPARWDGVREGSRFGAICPQIVGGEVKGDEDCLYINVWRPREKPDRPLPVMVWVHGGGNHRLSGEGSEQFGGVAYNGEQLVPQGVVFVSYNLRLGVLGFLSHAALSAERPEKISGNYGSLDQIAMLRWINRNIAASLIGHSGSSAFQTIHHYSVDVAHGLALLFGIGTRGPSIMGFEDEVEQSFGRPCRQTNGRSKRTCELTSSIVPRGTSFHRSVELECPSIGLDAARFFMLLLSGGLAVRRTVGPSGHANSPHPSSREGHHSTARWSSSVLLLD